MYCFQLNNEQYKICRVRSKKAATKIMNFTSVERPVPHSSLPSPLARPVVGQYVTTTAKGGRVMVSVRLAITRHRDKAIKNREVESRPPPARCEVHVY